MSAHPSLVQEIESVVNGRLGRGENVVVAWLKQEMLQRHQEIEGADRDFYLICASDALEHAIKEFLSKCEKQETKGDDPDLAKKHQPTFPGFPEIQRGYLVVRGDERMVIATENMTHEELLAKADAYDKMAEGCRRHARQLRRFAAERFEDVG